MEEKLLAAQKRERELADEVVMVQNKHLEEMSREKEEKDRRKGEDDKVGYLEGMDLPPSESEESSEED